MPRWYAIAGIASLTLAGAASGEDAPKVELWPERLTSVNDDGGALRCEPSAALRGAFGVVAWNDSWGGRHDAMAGVSVAWATQSSVLDAWTFHGYLPDPEARPTPGGADSRIAFDDQGRFHLLLLSWTDRGKALRLFRADPADADALTELTPPRQTTGALLDKPDFEIDGGRMYIAYRDEMGIAAVRSDDEGRTWSEPVRLSKADGRLRSGVAIEGDGDTVIAVWWEAGDGSQEIWFARSDDAGATFAPPELLRTLPRPIRPIDGYALGVGPAGDMNSDVAVAEHDGRFFVSFLEQTEGGSRILLSESIDDGKTWSEPVVVGNGDGADKAFPSIAILSGQPAILYYDRRHDDAHDTSTDVYLSWRSPAGDWTDIRLTSVSTRWDLTPGDREHAMVQRNFGDYITLASDGDRFLASWTDGRDGVPRIYTRRGRIEPER